MKGLALLAIFVFISGISFSQKKPLDHTVYDGWQNIGETDVSNNGKWIVYNINPQEGDNQLIIQSQDGAYKKTIERGYQAAITSDSRFVIFNIKPFFKDTREATIKNLPAGRQGKKPAEMPKDSLAIIELGKEYMWKKPMAGAFKIPAEGTGWLAYQLEKKPTAAKPDDKKVIDSLQKIIDSLKSQKPVSTRKKKNEPMEIREIKDAGSTDAEGEEESAEAGGANFALVLRDLTDSVETIFERVKEYAFDKKGTRLVFTQVKKERDSLSKALVLLYDLQNRKMDTISAGGNIFKNFSFSDDGRQLAFVAERDAKPKELQPFFGLWYYTVGMDTARLLADKRSVGMQVGMKVSEYTRPYFNKPGDRLFFYTMPITASKDTTLVEMDLVKLDVWHYKDDYLQPVQLKRLKADQERDYLALYDLANKKIEQLGSPAMPVVYEPTEGGGNNITLLSDTAYRIESQWSGDTRKDVYRFDLQSGKNQLVKKGLSGAINADAVSPSGNYTLWFDNKDRQYYLFDGKTTRSISTGIKVSLTDEENDVPAPPRAYGLMGWEANDAAVYIYDRYDVWRIPLTGKSAPQNIFAGEGRRKTTVFRYIKTDPEEKYIFPEKPILFTAVNRKTKRSNYYFFENGKLVPAFIEDQPYAFNGLKKARETDVYVYTKESYISSPDLYSNTALNSEKKLSAINPQQQQYNWGSAELYEWKTFSGKTSTGILYKPEDFSPTKKYPIIFYFYEKLSDGLYNYIAPSPTPSRLNISFFVSRGYLVFAPDITYTIGHPAKSAYDYIVSAAKNLSAKSWVDASRMGIQGQSWGGIQVAQLITMTNMFKAAWSGAPVANMTSAYGGIRWGTGLNRQFQYEKTQSRIGATLWEKPQLYMENSPLFGVPKIKTPLVIMHNDQDGAVPWYQGIELFTAMRRLGKQVWMLNYNGEDHNLVQRKNRKDIQIREQQYFDWLLKDAKPAPWIRDGVPAVKKGKDWGLE